MINLRWFVHVRLLRPSSAWPRLPARRLSPFPSAPITMIVPWAPGGSTDLTSRVLAEAAEKHLGQPIVILNKPGASTIIGMRDIAAGQAGRIHDRHAVELQLPGGLTGQAAATTS